jgi:hypothetical protein
MRRLKVRYRASRCLSADCGLGAPRAHAHLAAIFAQIHRAALSVFDVALK